MSTADTPLHDGAAAAQTAVGRMREELLGGRGPGAGRVEFLRHTRSRTTVAGVPVAALRERVAVDAATARNDPDTLALAAARQRAVVAADVDDLLTRLRPRPSLGGAKARVGHHARLRRSRAAVGVLAAWLVARWLVRSQRHPR